MADLPDRKPVDPFQSEPRLWFGVVTGLDEASVVILSGVGGPGHINSCSYWHPVGLL